MSTATDPRPATLEELKARHAKTPAQVAALRAAEYEMDEQHAGNFVAYTDDWDGDALTRTVVACAPTVAAFHEQLERLQPDVRARVALTQIPPANALSAPSAFLT